MDLPRQTSDAAAEAQPGRRAARPGRHRATAVARAVRDAPAQGLPALAPRRAAAAGVGLAAAAVGAGLVLPVVTGTASDDAPSRATAAVPTADAVPAVQLVAGQTLWPVPETLLDERAERTPPAYAVGARVRRGDGGSGADGADGAGGAEGAVGSTAPGATPHPGRSGDRDAPGPAGDGTDGTGGSSGGRDGTDGGSGGSGSGSAGDPTGSDPGALDPVETTVAPVRDALPSPVGDLVDGGVALVEDTVAGPLGAILP